jgi:hypothetical protein
MSQPVRFTHNTRNPRLRYTVAYAFDKNADGTLDVTYGIAQCRKGDSFSRAEGRKMAEARLNKARKGKQAAVVDAASGTALVPLYGTLSVQDHAGLSVGKFVAETFESDRQKTLAYNSQNSLHAIASQIFGPSMSKALGFGY